MDSNTFVMISRSELEETINAAALLAVEKYCENTMKSNGGNDNPMTTEEAADFLKVKVSTLYTKVSNREIAACKKGKRLYFLRDDLVDYVSKGRRAPRDEIIKNVGDYMVRPKTRKNEK